jgi:hypothetical protein
LALLVEPLYGQHPGVGVRELMQNSVDAVRELEAWCEKHGKTLDDIDLPKIDCDVLIEFIRREDSSWFLRVTDRGIGMTADTIQNYFLRAGASFRQSAEWMKEFVDEQGESRVLRAGRFGIGAFATFLLGQTFSLETRHVGGDQGYFVTASEDSRLIEIRRSNEIQVGSKVEIELSPETVDYFQFEKDKKDANYYKWRDPGFLTDWFCWEWPIVKRRITRGDEVENLPQTVTEPIKDLELMPEWSVMHPKDFDAVYWTFLAEFPLSCNGIGITGPERNDYHAEFVWPDYVGLNSPAIAVLDGGGNLPLTIQRDYLADQFLLLLTN